MIGFLQRELRKLWTDEFYSEAFRGSTVVHKDFGHALKHIRKAAQVLENLTEEADHSGSSQPIDPATLRKYLADILISTLRLANVAPGGPIDLEKAVLERIERKMGATLAPPEGSSPQSKTLKECQSEVNAWILQRAGGYWNAHQIYTHLGSEVGELGKEINHDCGPLTKKAEEKASSIEEESGDIVRTVICLLNSRGLSLDRAFEIAMSKCYGRDKDRFPLVEPKKP